MASQMRRKKLGYKIGIYTALSMFAFVVVVPFFHIVLSSFKSFEEVTQGTAAIFPAKSNFTANLKEVWGDSKYDFLRAFGNTLLVFALKTVGALVKYIEDCV